MHYIGDNDTEKTIKEEREQKVFKERSFKIHLLFPHKAEYMSYHSKKTITVTINFKFSYPAYKYCKTS